MKRQAIPDFTDTELSVVRKTARQPFRFEVPNDPIEGKVRIDPSDHLHRRHDTGREEYDDIGDGVAALADHAAMQSTEPG